MGEKCIFKKVNIKKKKKNMYHSYGLYVNDLV